MPLVLEITLSISRSRSGSAGLNRQERVRQSRTYYEF
jgi:hypothetical protein